MNKKFVQIEGLNIGYREGGVGKHIVLLHGWGIDGSSYLGLLELLEKKYHVIAPDFPGFGLSDAPEEAWDVSAYKQFVLKFVDALGISHFSVIAHSFGGRVSLKLGAENAEMVDAMVLTGCAGIKPKKSLKRLAFGAVAKGGKLLFSLPFPDTFKRGARKLLYKVVREHDYEKLEGVMKEVFKKVVAEDLRSYLKDVRPKVLLLWGANDRSTPLADGQLMERRMPKAELKVYEGVGHRLPYERAAELAEDVIQFIN
jgi:pimeloyl-ACP methyl ester carboxylesterase